MPHFQRRQFLIGAAASAAALSIGPLSAKASEVNVAKLQHILSGSQRLPEDGTRDRYRHPIETLEFLGVSDRSTVVEIAPGGGWWTAILAPYLEASGIYYMGLSALPPNAPPKMVQGRKAFIGRLHADPADFGKVRITDMATASMPANSADFLLTFRNLHNWMEDGSAGKILASFYRTVKPGGVFGIEDHRGDPKLPQDPLAKSGYVREDVARAMIERAGFKFAARSDIYANPRDTKDYPSGVWTLPPTFILKDQDRAKYAAIGEADGFLMKFVKPA